MEDFAQSLAFTLREEGGFVDDPRDRGEATNMGITLATLRDWTGDADLQASDVATLTSDVAASIYGANYWNQLRCDALPRGIDLMVFDFGVNAGCVTSARLLQQALGFAGADVDGSIGPYTLAEAAARVARIGGVVALRALLVRQQARYRALPGFATFGTGWLARAGRRFAAAAAMISGAGVVS